MILRFERQNFSDTTTIGPDLIKGTEIPAECPGPRIVPASYLSAKNTVSVFDVICHPNGACAQSNCPFRRIVALDAQ